MPCLHPVPLLNHFVDCGWCAECCAKYARVWTQRILDEFESCGRVGCFVTLTYSDFFCPDDLQVNKRDLQLFMKRLRKAISPAKVRFFSCGEYGGKRNRPHYHVILFGYRPDDLKVAYRDREGHAHYRSAFFARVWKAGFVDVMDVTEDSAKYCAKYLSKADPRYHEVRPFTNMSRRPGIGEACVTPEMLLTGERYINGKAEPLPRYYLDKLDQAGFDTKWLRRLRSVYLDQCKKMTDDEFRFYVHNKENFLRSFAPRAFLPLLY